MNETKEKELNLCELLKGYEKEKFYSPMLSDVFIVQLRETSIHIVPCDEGHSERFLFIDKRGVWVKGGQCVLFPSRALYEKYPLDAYSAWMEWKESKKKKIELFFDMKIAEEGADELLSAEFVLYEFDSYEEAVRASGVVDKAIREFQENK